MPSGGAGRKYLNLIARALKATRSALKWKAKSASAFAVNCGGKCDEVGVSYGNNSFTCHNVLRSIDLQQFRCVTEFFKLLDFFYILGFCKCN